eukprot:14580450-Alexandrium_andersonii.AAC.1
MNSAPDCWGERAEHDRAAAPDCWVSSAGGHGQAIGSSTPADDQAGSLSADSEAILPALALALPARDSGAAGYDIDERHPLHDAASPTGLRGARVAA